MQLIPSPYTPYQVVHNSLCLLVDQSIKIGLHRDQIVAKAMQFLIAEAESEKLSQAEKWDLMHQVYFTTPIYNHRIVMNDKEYQPYRVDMSPSVGDIEITYVGFNKILAIKFLRDCCVEHELSLNPGVFEKPGLRGLKDFVEASALRTQYISSSLIKLGITAQDFVKAGFTFKIVGPDFNS